MENIQKTEDTQVMVSTGKIERVNNALAKVWDFITSESFRDAVSAAGEFVMDAGRLVSEVLDHIMEHGYEISFKKGDCSFKFGPSAEQRVPGELAVDAVVVPNDQEDVF